MHHLRGNPPCAEIAHRKMEIWFVCLMPRSWEFDTIDGFLIIMPDSQVTIGEKMLLGNPMLLQGPTQRPLALIDPAKAGESRGGEITRRLDKCRQ